MSQTLLMSFCIHKNFFFLTRPTFETGQRDANPECTHKNKTHANNMHRMHVRVCTFENTFWCNMPQHVPLHSCKRFLSGMPQKSLKPTMSHYDVGLSNKTKCLHSIHCDSCLVAQTNEYHTTTKKEKKNVKNKVAILAKWFVQIWETALSGWKESNIQC